MKRTRQLDQCYSGLAAGERVQLVIAAIARDDAREHDLLTRSCRTQLYRGPEHHYVEILELASEFATLFGAVEVGPRAAGLSVLHGFREVVVQLFALLEVDTDSSGADETDPSVPEDEQAVAELGCVLLRVLDRMEERLLGESAAVARGFDAFCSAAIGVQGAQLIAAFARPFEDEFEWMLTLSHGDSELSDGLANELRDVWRFRLGLTPLEPSRRDEEAAEV